MKKKILAAVFLALVALTSAKAYTGCANGGGELVGIQQGDYYYRVCQQGGQPYTDYTRISMFTYYLWYTGLIDNL